MLLLTSTKWMNAIITTASCLLMLCLQQSVPVHAFCCTFNSRRPQQLITFTNKPISNRIPFPLITTNSREITIETITTSNRLHFISLRAQATDEDDNSNDTTTSINNVDQVFLQTDNNSNSSNNNNNKHDADDDTDEYDFEILFQETEDEPSETPKVPLDAMERAWRYATKPLLRIGSKGATLTHGNSLRQLLERHTVVKVKVNTRRFNDSLQTAFEHLRQLAEDSGAPKGIELIQTREADHIILFGMPGTLELIQKNQFPPVSSSPSSSSSSE